MEIYEQLQYISHWHCWETIYATPKTNKMLSNLNFTFVLLAQLEPGQLHGTINHLAVFELGTKPKTNSTRSITLCTAVLRYVIYFLIWWLNADIEFAIFSWLFGEFHTVYCSFKFQGINVLFYIFDLSNT